MPGKIYVVSSPIGNLDDLSSRARDVLAQADLVACEDTRRSGRLLAHLGIKKRLVSMHEHNETKRLPFLVEALDKGLTIAVLSDAGTPLLSDPGFLLIREAASREIPVEPIPGPLGGEPTPEQLEAMEEEMRLARQAQENVEIRKSVGDFVDTDPKYAAAILRKWMRERN